MKLKKFFKKVCEGCHGKGHRGELHSSWWSENPCSFCKGTKEQWRWGRIWLVIFALFFIIILIWG